MEDFDFEPGSGIRACTTRVRRWIITRFVFASRPASPALPTEIER
jgi:hypothetical protein